MRCVIAILSGLLLSAAAEASEKFYKWQDADGTWHYTATPPADRSAVELRVYHREPSAAVPDAPAAPAAPATPDTTASATPDPNPRTDAQIAEARRASCEQARRNVQTLQNATAARMDLDRDGTPEDLSAEQITAQLTRARQQVQEFCDAGGGG